MGKLKVKSQASEWIFRKITCPDCLSSYSTNPGFSFWLTDAPPFLYNVYSGINFKVLEHNQHTIVLAFWNPKKNDQKLSTFHHKPTALPGCITISGNQIRIISRKPQCKNPYQTCL
ncbi:MAG TPA: hypothetical protein DCL86_19060 [Bacteroidales bacterium]|jgi:hypothetical protein|nr:hypothetical protein [Bacteroidales bacterium]